MIRIGIDLGGTNRPYPLGRGIRFGPDTIDFVLDSQCIKRILASPASPPEACARMRKRPLRGTRGDQWIVESPPSTCSRFHDSKRPVPS